jgi:hypothetical protein
VRIAEFHTLVQYNEADMNQAVEQMPAVVAVAVVVAAVVAAAVVVAAVAAVVAAGTVAVDVAVVGAGVEELETALAMADAAAELLMGSIPWVSVVAGRSGS